MYGTRYTKTLAGASLVLVLLLLSWGQAAEIVINSNDIWSNDSAFNDGDTTIVNNGAILTVDGDTTTGSKVLSSMTLGQTTDSPSGVGTGTLSLMATGKLSVDSLTLGDENDGILNLANGSALTIANSINFNRGTVVNEKLQDWTEQTINWSDTNTVTFDGSGGFIYFGSNANGAKLALLDGTLNTSGDLDASNFTLNGGILQTNGGTLTYTGQLAAGATLEVMGGTTWSTDVDQGQGNITLTKGTITLNADQDFATGGGLFTMSGDSENPSHVDLNGYNMNLGDVGDPSRITGGQFSSLNTDSESIVSWNSGTIQADFSRFFYYGPQYDTVGVALSGDAILEITTTTVEEELSTTELDYSVVRSLTLTENATITGGLLLYVTGDATIMSDSGINESDLFFDNSGSTIIDSGATFNGKITFGYNASNTIANGTFNDEISIEGSGATVISGGTFTNVINLSGSGTTALSGGNIDSIAMLDTTNTNETVTPSTATLSIVEDITINGANSVLIRSGTMNLASGKSLTLVAGELLMESGVGTGGTLTGEGTLVGNLNMTAGMLTGNVIVDGNITQTGGTIAPGNSIGVTTVTGDLSLADATIEVGESGNSDKIVVEGQTTLTDGGTMTITSLSSSIMFHDGDQYTTIQSAGTITDEGYSVESGVAGFNASAAIVGNDYVVTLQRSINSFSTGAHNANHVVDYLYDLYYANDQQSEVMAGIQSDTNQQLAAEKVSGESHMTGMQTLMNTGIIRLHTLTEKIRPNMNSRFFESNLADNRNTTARGQFDPHAEFEGTNVWYAGYGMGGHIIGNENTSPTNVSFSGLMVGIEGIYSGGSERVGVFYDRSYASTDVVQLDARNQIDTNFFGAYHTRELEDGYRLLTFGFGEDRYRSRRVLEIGSGNDQLNETARSGYHGWQSMFYAERGYDLQGTWQGLQPYLGLQYSYIRRNAFEETGAEYAGLDLDAESYDSLRGYLGMRWDLPFLQIGHGVKTGRPLGGFFQLQTAWIHEMLDKTTPICNAQLGASTLSNNFVVEGADCGRDWWLLSLGTKWRLGKSLSLYGDYTLLLNTRQTFHTGSGGVCLSW